MLMYVVLAGVMLKLGTYGFVRISIPILPDEAVRWAPWIGLLAVFIVRGEWLATLVFGDRFAGLARRLCNA